MPQITINNFQGGIYQTTRAESSNTFDMASQFDIYQSERLEQVPSYELSETVGVDTDAMATKGVNHVEIVDIDAIAVSNVTNDSKTTPYRYRLGNNDWVDGLAGTDATDPITRVIVPGSVYSPNGSAGRIFFFNVEAPYNPRTGGSAFASLGRFDVNETDRFVSNLISNTAIYRGIGNTPQPHVTEGPDDNGYMAMGNTIYQIDKVANTAAEFYEIPENIRSMFTWGQNLCVMADLRFESIMYIFNPTNGYADPIDRIPIGQGSVVAGGVVDGQIIAVVDRFVNIFAPYGNNEGSLLVMTLNGNQFSSGRELRTQPGSGDVFNWHYIYKGRLVWYAKFTDILGVVREGIWSFGRNLINEDFALTLLVDTSGIGTAGTPIDSFSVLGNIIWVVKENRIYRTVETQTFTIDGKLETNWYDGGGRTVEKILEGVSLVFDKLTSGQSVAIDYRTTEGGAWTEILNENTVGAEIARANQTTSGESFNNFYKIQFRFRVTGGATIYGFTAEYNGLSNTY